MFIYKFHCTSISISLHSPGATLLNPTNAVPYNLVIFSFFQHKHYYFILTVSCHIYELFTSSLTWLSPLLSAHKVYIKDYPHNSYKYFNMNALCYILFCRVAYPSTYCSSWSFWSTSSPTFLNSLAFSSLERQKRNTSYIIGSRPTILQNTDTPDPYSRARNEATQYNNIFLIHSQIHSITTRAEGRGGLCLFPPSTHLEVGTHFYLIESHIDISQ